MPTNVQQALATVRKPRVHITYDVETEGAAVRRELPFVVGVIGDFSGQPREPVRPLRERRFVDVDRDTFDDVLGRTGPGLRLRVEDRLSRDGGELTVELAFRSMADFEPAALVGQIEPLRRLLAARDKLRDLMAWADRSEPLETLLEEVLGDPARIEALAGQLRGEG